MSVPAVPRFSREKPSQHRVIILHNQPFYSLFIIHYSLTSMNLISLAQLLNEFFSTAEINTLAFNLYVDSDNLRGEIKREKAQALVNYANNRGYLTQLLGDMQAINPSIAPDLAALQTPPDLPPPVVDTAVLQQTYPAPLADLQRALQRGRLTFFIGADLGHSQSGFPSRQLLADGLARQAGVAPGRRLAEVAQEVMQAGNRFTFTQYLREQLDPVGHTPQPLLRTLAGLVQEHELETLVTTDYGEAIEAAFRAQGIGLNTAVRDSDLQFANPDYPTLLKLYGDWQQPATLTVTTQDENQLVRGRVSDKQNLLDELIRAFRRTTLLFIGYDLVDPVVNALFDEVAGDQFQRTAYAVWSGLSDTAVSSYATNRGLIVLDTDPLLLLQYLLNGE